jgi:fused signal recognition particle receptor
MIEIEEKTSWLSRLKTGLGKSSAKLSDGITGIFTKRKLDAESIEELEELLIASDMGIATATAITDKIARNRFNKEISPEEVREEVAECVAEILAPYAKPLIIDTALKPQVIVVCGVNGNGKTTTIGKLAKQYKEEGKSVMIAACDTFRAAAVSQLEIWAERTNSPLIQGAHEAEPASVAYKALQQAREVGADVLLIDTAGRLQNKSNLMDELAKTIRVLKKLDPATPHNTLLVLDATTGQNAHSQVDIFKKMVNLTGIIVTKLDGTAKGGVVVALAKHFKLPIHAIGVGEGINDLRPFDARSFARSLMGI